MMLNVARSLAAALPWWPPRPATRGSRFPESAGAPRGPPKASLTDGNSCRPTAPPPSSEPGRCRQPRSPARTRTCSLPWSPLISSTVSEWRKLRPSNRESSGCKWATFPPPAPRKGRGREAPPRKFLRFFVAALALTKVGVFLASPRSPQSTSGRGRKVPFFLLHYSRFLAVLLSCN